MNSDLSKGKQPFTIEFVDIWAFLTSCFALFVAFGMYKEEWLLVLLGLPTLIFTLYHFQKMLMSTELTPSKSLWNQ